MDPVYAMYLLAFVLASAACSCAAWRAWSVPYADTRHALVTFFSTSGAWAGTYVGVLLAGPALAKHIFYQASLIVGFGTVFAWLWFCSAYSGHGLHRYRKVQWAAAITFLVVTGLKVTNPLHGLYYGLEPTGGAFGLVVNHGTLYWVVMALAYALAAAGYLMLFEVFLKTDVRTGPLVALTGLTALPAVLNVAGHLSPSLLDVTHEPLGVAVFAMGVLFAYTYQFSAVRVTGSLDEPNLMLGADGQIRDYGGGASDAIPELGPGAIGKPLGDVLPGLAEVLGEGRSVWTRPSGPDRRHFRIVETTLEGTKGSKVVILSDISERFERQKAISSLYEKYQSLLEGAPNAILVADTETGHIREVNQAAASLLEAKPGDLVGRHQLELHPSEEAEKYRFLFEKAIREVRSRRDEGLGKTVRQLADGSQLYVETDSGRRVPVEISATAAQLEDGEVLIGIFRDVTEQTEREKALRAAKEEAEAAARLKAAMLANMSHEIRTPLTSIIGFAETIGEDKEAASRFAPLIEKSGKRLLETLDGILNLSKLEAGQMELEAEPVDLAGQAEAIAGQFRPEAEGKGISLRVETESASARADEGGVQIVLQNLISNAVKYTEEGRVQLRTYRENGAAIIEVEDTGIGMDPELAEGLFEPFRQASEGLSREYEGTGVGLAVTKKAVDQMGGSVAVETQKGEGSRFTVRLPRFEEDTSENRSS